MFGMDGQIKYEDKKKVIVFLNGSNHWADWIANFSFRSKGGIHSQWAKMVDEAGWLQNVAAKCLSQEKQLIIVGYSMGGACAEIFAFFKMETFSNLKLYLFGAPKGLSRRNQDELYSRCSVFRFRNRRDIVPILPLRFRQSKRAIRVYLPNFGHKWEGYQSHVDNLVKELTNAKEDGS